MEEGEESLPWDSLLFISLLFQEVTYRSNQLIKPSCVRHVSPLKQLQLFTFLRQKTFKREMLIAQA